MFSILTLVDVTMVANLIAMVVIGGYETLVNRLHLSPGEVEDRPDWLEHVTASSLKIKLAASLIGISAIHLLKAFLDLGSEHEHTTEETYRNLQWKVIVHLVFLGSAIALSVSERLLYPPQSHGERDHDAPAGGTQTGQAAPHPSPV
jgi:uncharacterized protein (TIGR00645 family)